TTAGFRWRFSISSPTPRRSRARACGTFARASLEAVDHRNATSGERATRMSCEIRFDENTACERCGKFGAYEFDGARLCVDCYETRGSCCPEFGSDDLWRATAAMPADTKLTGPAPDTAQKHFPLDRGSEP